MELILCLILAAIWGGIWALFLQYNTVGRFLAARRTWLTVVIGVGVDLLLLLALLPITIWLQITAVVCASSIGLIARSIVNEWHDHRALMEIGCGDTDQAR